MVSEFNETVFYKKTKNAVPKYCIFCLEGLSKNLSFSHQMCN